MLIENCQCQHSEPGSCGEMMVPPDPWLSINDKELIDHLGSKLVEEIPVIVSPFYDDLLAWVTVNYIKESGWEILRIIGKGNNPEPRYRQINIGPDQEVEVMANGCMLLQRDRTRLAVQIWLWRMSMIIVSCAPANKCIGEQFAADIEKLIKERNPYKGNKIYIDGSISFLEIERKDWCDLILDESVKEEIKFNTVGFLSHRHLLSKYGIPAKRGIILAGKPGTGKTLISKIIMSQSNGITCIQADSSELGDPHYIESIYEVADDLKPCIVFLEDVDIAGTDRFAEGNPREAGLVALLEALDGIEDCDGIVTIATTNCLQVLDKALKERPQRFDLVLEMDLPEIEERRRLLRTLSKNIPIDEKIQNFIAEKTCGFTPAQLQEVVFNMVIRKQNKNGPVELETPLNFSLDDATCSIARVARQKKVDIGFRYQTNS